VLDSDDASDKPEKPGRKKSRVEKNEISVSGQVAGNVLIPGSASCGTSVHVAEWIKKRFNSKKRQVAGKKRLVGETVSY
jgi:hypothetical protein